jgi:hypothetical protein
MSKQQSVRCALSFCCTRRARSWQRRCLPRWRAGCARCLRARRLRQASCSRPRRAPPLCSSLLSRCPPPPRRRGRCRCPCSQMPSLPRRPRTACVRRWFASCTSVCTPPRLASGWSAARGTRPPFGARTRPAGAHRRSEWRRATTLGAAAPRACRSTRSWPRSTPRATPASPPTTPGGAHLRSGWLCTHARARCCTCVLVCTLAHAARHACAYRRQVRVQLCVLPQPRGR